MIYVGSVSCKQTRTNRLSFAFIKELNTVVDFLDPSGRKMLSCNIKGSLFESRCEGSSHCKLTLYQMTFLLTGPNLQTTNEMWVKL